MCYAARVRSIASACPSAVLADLFLRPVEWRAFSAYLRTRTIDRAPQPVAGSAIPEAVWEQCWSGAEVEPDCEHFAAAARAIQAAMPREKHDERLVDEITLIHECRDLRCLAEQVDSALITEWVTTWLRLRFGLALLRCCLNEWGHSRTANALVGLGVARDDVMTLASPGRPAWRAVFARLGAPEVESVPEADTEPAPIVERLCHNAVTRLTREARAIPFGPEPVFAFLWAITTEAVNLRLVATGLAAGLPRDLIAEDIRETYG